MEWLDFTYASLEILPLLWHQSLSYLEKLKCSNGLLNVKSLGRISKTDTFKLLYILISPNWELEFHVHTYES